MAKMNIDEAQSSDMSNVYDDYEIESWQVDSAQDQKETEWQNNKWQEYWGAFNTVPDLKSAFLMKSIWNVGKGYTTDNRTQVILDNITGWGKDTFDDILFNADLISSVGGDSYCEIMRNDQGTLINLKPLDPGAMKHIVDSKGRLIRFEQFAKVTKNKVPFAKVFGQKTTTKITARFKPNEIFYLGNNRLADQIHGISDIESLEPTMKADGESFDDLVKVAHRQARPFIIFKLKTDDPTKIDEIISKIDTATKDGENMYIPDDDNILSYEVVQVNISQVLMAWRNDIKNRFYRALGIPLILFGASGSTESGGKMEVFAHETRFEHRQRYLEKQIWNQLALKIDLNPPASLAPDLQQDNAKDGQLKATQPNDTTAGRGE